MKNRHRHRHILLPLVILSRNRKTATKKQASVDSDGDILHGITDSSGDEVSRHQHENSIDSFLHDSDTEYDEDDKDLATLLVTPACQLRSHIRNLIKHTRTVLQDEWSEYVCFRYPVKDLPDNTLRPDHQHVWWTETPKTQSMVIPSTRQKQVARYH